MTESEINTAFEEKVKRGIFKPVQRHLSNPATVEDRMQDAVALTWLMFRRYAQKGRILDDAILVLKCRWCACNLVVLGGGPEPCQGRARGKGVRRAFSPGPLPQGGIITSAAVY